jgi:hypothetical protein
MSRWAFALDNKWLVAEGNACLVGPNATAEEAYVQQAQI